MNFCRNVLNAPVPLPYFIADQPIKDVNNHKNLGVRVDASIKFHLHVREIAGKAGGICFSILKGAHCRSPEFMNCFYFTCPSHP